MNRRLRGAVLKRFSLRARLAVFTGGLLIAVCILLTLFTAIVGGQPVQSATIVGLTLVAAIAASGSYWMAGIEMRPLTRMSRVARRISATSLNTRLDVDGPRDELRDMAESFNAMLDRLENAFAQQSRFVADAAHELRTPLASVRTNIEIVGGDPNATLDDYRRTFTTVERGVTRLERLINDLLVLAAEERQAERVPVALEPLLEDCVSQLEQTATERGVRLELAEMGGVYVRGDARLLAHVFSNVIENGIRYNRRGGQVCVSAERDTAGVAVRVVDTGIGIAPDAQPHIFERFYRAEGSRSRHNGGAGLGLAIVAQIVAQHGGTVEVASEQGKGSAFVVRLPAADLNVHLTAPML